MSQSEDPTVDALAAAIGIQSSYVDLGGTRRETSAATKRALLAACGFVDQSADALVAQAAEVRRDAWGELLPPVYVLQDPKVPILPVLVPQKHLGDELTWLVCEESGTERAGQARLADLARLEACVGEGERFARVALPVGPSLPWGYHRVNVELCIHGRDSVASAASVLIAAPPRCYVPEPVASGARLWGLAAQLYSLVSDENCGIGDFGDLRRLIDRLADRGPSFVGLNPLHALFPHKPDHFSPYSPSSRLFLNPLYIDLDQVPELSALGADDGRGGGRFTGLVRDDELAALRRAELIDYPRVAELKQRVLRALYAVFRRQHLQKDTARAAEFRAFVADEGKELALFATFDALQVHFYQQDPALWGWPVWPAPYRDPTSVEVVRFAALQREEVEYFQYVQWLADSQLEAVARHAKQRGLSVGLYRDLAVGADGPSAEAWINQACFARGVAVGAPPDDFNADGQNWGLLPLRPDKLREYAYRPFVEIVRRNMRHAGALRLDHVMALMRLYWVPQGESAKAGAYVSYPVDDLLAIVALESHRHQCLVIGEDLGTVPDDFRARLGERGVLSYRVLFFERGDGGTFKAPGDYPPQAAAVVSTHDLPTMAGWVTGADILARRAVGMIADEHGLEAQRDGRRHDCRRLLEALRGHGATGCGEAEDAALAAGALPSTLAPATAAAIHQYLASAPCQLLIAQLEDLIGMTEQANLPGTIDQHPNWRRKLPVAVEALAENAYLQAQVAAIRKERR